MLFQNQFHFPLQSVGLFSCFDGRLLQKRKVLIPLQILPKAIEVSISSILQQVTPSNFNYFSITHPIIICSKLWVAPLCFQAKTHFYVLFCGKLNAYLFIYFSNYSSSWLWHKYGMLLNSWMQKHVFGGEVPCFIKTHSEAFITMW